MPSNPLETNLEIDLERYLRPMSISYNAIQFRQWMDYLHLLHKWNQKINLTAIRSVKEMIPRHIAESLSLVNYILGDRLIDVGCGAGVPGIPLAIMFPEKQVFLLDSNHKKQIFVSQAVKTLGLENVVCVHSWVEEYQPSEKFSTILTRAFKPFAQMLGLTQHLVDPNGQFLAMVGKVPADGFQLEKPYTLEQVVPMRVPNMHVQRHLAIIKKIEE
jgi:16S rRNA (guanine527-N7)-methyltransferase